MLAEWRRAQQTGVSRSRAKSSDTCGTGSRRSDDAVPAPDLALDLGQAAAYRVWPSQRGGRSLGGCCSTQASDERVFLTDAVEELGLGDRVAVGPLHGGGRSAMIRGTGRSSTSSSLARSDRRPSSPNAGHRSCVRAGGSWSANRPSRTPAGGRPTNSPDSASRWKLRPGSPTARSSSFDSDTSRQPKCRAGLESRLAGPDGDCST